MKKLILIVAYLLITIPCTAKIITVDNNGPADFNNIQAAIDDANDGDTVLVAPGIYTGDGNRDIDFLGKQITVKSEDPEDPCVVAATVIDCENIPSHRGFYFHSAEGPNSVLSGFTIKKGRIEKGIAKGGGIYCYRSSPTIEYCTITDNTVIGTDSVILHPNGSLILPVDPNTPITIVPSVPIIIDINIPDLPIPMPAITGNTAAGGGIYIEGGSYWDWGGPIIINPAYDPPIYNPISADPTIYKCRIVNNNVIGPAEKEWFESLWIGGGGIASSGGKPEIIDCVISNNTARGGDGVDTEAGGSVRGGGIAMGISGGSLFEGPEIINCLISNNAAIGGNGGPGAPLDGGNAYGGGIYGSATVINSLVSNNIASAGEGGQANGGAVSSPSVPGSITLINSTISQNTSLNGAAVVCGSHSTITNSILWANAASPVIDATESIIFHSQDPNISTISITYNDVEGGCPGTGNIDADPCFVNPDSNDFHLLPTSPCINAGDPNFIPEPNDTDLDGSPRIAAGRIDMGAYETTMHQARLWIKPRALSRKYHKSKWIIAWMYLPEEISKDQVDTDTPMTLYPGGIKAKRQYVFGNQGPFDGRTRVLAFFDSREFLNAVDTTGLVRLRAIGFLKEPGQYFIGSDFIIIAGPQPRWRF